MLLLLHQLLHGLGRGRDGQRGVVVDDPPAEGQPGVCDVLEQLAAPLLVPVQESVLQPGENRVDAVPTY